MYSASASVVTNGKWSNMRAILSKMEMHVDTILMFMWMQKYAASISVFPNHDDFRWIFDYYGCNNVGYYEEAESIEAWLGGVFQDTVIYQ